MTPGAAADALKLHPFGPTSFVIKARAQLATRALEDPPVPRGLWEAVFELADQQSHIDVRRLAAVAGARRGRGAHGTWQPRGREPEVHSLGQVEAVIEAPVQSGREDKDERALSLEQLVNRYARALEYGRREQCCLVAQKLRARLARLRVQVGREGAHALRIRWRDHVPTLRRAAVQVRGTLQLTVLGVHREE